MSYHDHDRGSGFQGKGRFAGVERLIPEVQEPVEMLGLRVPEASMVSPGNPDVRLARITGEVTPIGIVGVENLTRPTVVTVFSGLATLAGLRISG